MSTVTVRIHEHTQRSLKELAGETGQAIPDVLAKAIEEYRRRHFLHGLAADFAALRNDADAWSEEMEERGAWGATLSEGLAED